MVTETKQTKKSTVDTRLKMSKVYLDRPYEAHLSSQVSAGFSWKLSTVGNADKKFSFFNFNTMIDQHMMSKMSLELV